MQAAPPRLPFVIGARGRIEHVLDSRPVERLMDRNRAGMKTLLGGAGTKPEQLHLLVEACGIAEHAIVRSRHVETLPWRAAHPANPRKLVQMPEREVKRLATAHREARHRAMFPVGPGAK